MHKVTLTLAGLAGILAGAAPAQDNTVPAPVAFARDIAPIVYQHCTQCHRRSGPAPFELDSYADTKKHAKKILAAVKARAMPPWHAEPGHGEFVDERWLSDEQIGLIERWVAEGFERGDRKDEPKPPKFARGWQLGKPDHIVRMKTAATLPKRGAEQYRTFTIPLDLKRPVWVRGVEVQPESDAIDEVHVFFNPPAAEGQPNRGGRGGRGRGGRGGRGGRAERFLGSVMAPASRYLGSWAPWRAPRTLPQGLAVPVPEGASLRVRARLTPTGKSSREKLTVGLYLSGGPPAREVTLLQFPPAWGAGAEINVRAGQTFEAEDSFELPVAVEVVRIEGFAHHLGKEMRAVAMAPEDKEIPLLWIKDWDLTWRDVYDFASPVLLPASTTIQVGLTWDNTTDNPRNPADPPKRVRFGHRMSGEIGCVVLAVMAQDESDLPRLREAYAEHVAENSGAAQIGRSVTERLRDLDANGDGKIQKEELPEEYRRFFGMVDTDRSGAIEEDEMAALEKMLGGLGGGRGRKG